LARAPTSRKTSYLYQFLQFPNPNPTTNPPSPTGSQSSTNNPSTCMLGFNTSTASAKAVFSSSKTSKPRWTITPQSKPTQNLCPRSQVRCLPREGHKVKRNLREMYLIRLF